MSLSCKLWSTTGLVHCLVGLAIPELRDPLLRVLTEGTTEVSNNIADRYEREATVWFQVAGIMMILQAWAWKEWVNVTRREELPRWWGWSLTLMGIGGVKIMPQSGFWFVLAQGLRIVWRTSHGKLGDTTSMKSKMI